MAGEIKVNLLSAFNDRGVKDATSQLAGLGNGIRNLTKQLIGSYVGFQGLQKGVAFVGSTVAASRDLQRNLAGLSTIFGDSTSEMIKFSEAGVLLGMSTAEAAKATTFIGSVMKQSGFAMSENIVFTKKLVTLGADLAATYGYDVQEALTGMTALFRGEYDPIEKFGVAIKQAQVNALLASEGLKGLTGTALLNAQQLARMKLLLEATADAQGAVARQSNTLAVSQGQLAATFTNLKASLGNNLIGPITFLVKLMQGLTDVVGPSLQGMFAAIGGMFTVAGGNAYGFATQIANIIDQLTLLIQIAAPIFGFLTQVMGSSLAPLLTMVVVFKTFHGIVKGVGIVVGAYNVVMTTLGIRSAAVAAGQAAAATATVAAGAAAAGATGPTVALAAASALTPWGAIAIAVGLVAAGIAGLAMASANATPVTGALADSMGRMGSNMATGTGGMVTGAAATGVLTGNMSRLATATVEAAKANVIYSATIPDYQSARAAMRADDKKSAKNKSTPELDQVNAMLKAIKNVGGTGAAAGAGAKKAASAISNPFKDAVKKIKDELASLHDSLMGAFDITSMGKSGSTISRNMSKLMAKMREFTTLVKQLRERGLNADLLMQIVKAGPVAGLDAAKALAGSESLMQQANTSYGEYGALSAQVASEAIQAKYGNQYNIKVEGGVGSGATIGKAVVAAIQAFERQSGTNWRTT
jgi:hypothetical protein